MGTIKLNLPDSSPNGKRRLANAKGHKGPNVSTPSSSNNNTEGRNYPPSQRTIGTYSHIAQVGGGASKILTAMGGAGPTITAPAFSSPMHTPQNWQTPSKRKEIYQWSRFYYENEPKVAAGVDFYAQFPMNGFILECRNKEILQYYEQLIEDLKLNYWMKLISHEYYLLGDVFPFLEIDCKICHGSSLTPDNKICNHPDGKFKAISILNPDYVNVKDSPIPTDREYELIPDEELKKTVATREPRTVYDKLPEYIRKLVSSGQPIPLSKRSVSHIKHSECAYGKYGTSMLRRLFTILAYKSKLMTANWIIAERLILPVRVVKIGDKDRPAGPEDIAEIHSQMAAVANDPNLTIVTHHAFQYDWFGAEGKIHNIDSAMEQIGKEILDGLMLNQAILNGEMQGYAGAAVGIEILIKRIESWRNALADWIIEHIFKPTAQMQGFVDEDKSKKLDKTVYLTPTIKWNDLQLRDKSNRLQMLMQLFDKGLISAEKLLQEFDIDYDQEIERKRDEQMEQTQAGGAGGVAGGAGGGMPGGMGGPGGDPAAGGGAPPGGDPSGGAGGMPGAPGGMGGAPGGAPGGMGGAPGGGMGAAAGGPTPGKVYKKGKAPKAQKQDDTPPPAPTVIKLTKLEQKIWKVLQGMRVPYKLYGQFKQQIPGEQQPFIMDFAMPEIGVDIEADGAIWHEQEGRKEKDAERDRKLAAYGWRVLRFNEDAINSQLGDVQQVILDNIKQAAEERAKNKKAFSSQNIKNAMVEPEYEPMIQYVENGSGEIQVISGVILNDNDFGIQLGELDDSGSEED